MTTMTLTVASTTLNLNPDLFWVDENAWNPVRQTTERSLTGALIVDVAGLTAGQPITLAPYDQASAWMPRSAVEQLKAWAATPGLQMTLVLRGVTHTVMWRHQDEPALSAEPVQHFDDVQPTDFYRVSLKLMKV